MKTFASWRLVVAALGLAVLALGPTMTAQTALSNSTLSAAVTATATTIPVTSASGTFTVVGNTLYVDVEAMNITAVSTSPARLTVQRGVYGTVASAHASGATFLTAPGQAMIGADPVGPCTRAGNTYLPLINAYSGIIWSCDANLKWIGTTARILAYNSVQTR